VHEGVSDSFGGLSDGGVYKEGGYLKMLRHLGVVGLRTVMGNVN
jgi:hypothetical protein